MRRRKRSKRLWRIITRLAIYWAQIRALPPYWKTVAKKQTVPYRKSPPGSLCRFGRRQGSITSWSHGLLVTMTYSLQLRPLLGSLQSDQLLALLCLRFFICKMETCVCIYSCLTLCDPVDCSPPGSSVQRISQARTPGWFISFSKGSSRPRVPTCVSFISRQILYR